MPPLFSAGSPRKHEGTQGTGHFTVRRVAPRYRAHPLRFLSISRLRAFSSLFSGTRQRPMPHCVALYPQPFCGDVQRHPMCYTQDRRGGSYEKDNCVLDCVALSARDSGGSAKATPRETAASAAAPAAGPRDSSSAASAELGMGHACDTVGREPQRGAPHRKTWLHLDKRADYSSSAAPRCGARENHYRATTCATGHHCGTRSQRDGTRGQRLNRARTRHPTGLCTKGRRLCKNLGGGPLEGDTRPGRRRIDAHLGAGPLGVRWGASAPQRTENREQRTESAPAGDRTAV